MSLIDNIGQIHKRYCSLLDASHNYYIHTKQMWRLTEAFVEDGKKFTIKNLTTGDVADEKKIVGLAQGYVRGYLASSTFQEFVALFERFIADLLQLYLTEYPESLSGKQLKFQDVLEATNKDEIVDAVVQKKVFDLMYQPIDQLMRYIVKITETTPLDSRLIEQLAEIKASRNLLVHNNGIANAKYVASSGQQARHADGERLELPDNYHRESWELIKEVMGQLTIAITVNLNGSPSC